MSCHMPMVGNRTLNPLFFPGLQAWWNAEQPTLGGTSAQDLSGNGRVGVNMGGNVTLVNGVANGRTVFRFNGVNAELSYTVAPITTTTNFSAFALVKNTTNVTARTMQCWAHRTVNRQILAGNAANQLGCFDGATNPVSGVVDDYTNFSLIGVVCTAGSCEFFQNNVSQGVGVGVFASSVINTFGQVLTLVFATMDVGECVFYTTALSATQRTVVYEYFRERYNV